MVLEETSFEKSRGVADKDSIFLPPGKKGELNKPQQVRFSEAEEKAGFGEWRNATVNRSGQG